ncbi:MAG: hypothetical protein RSB20_01785 [Clostridia bacterium]
MKAIINLVRLQFKVYGDESLSAKNIKSKIGFLLPIALCVLAMAGLLLYSIIKIAGYFVSAQLSMEFIKILFFAVQVIQLVLGISVVSNTLFGAENEDLLKLPVVGIEIFSAKIIYLYIHELIFSTIVVFPILVAFGIMYTQAILFYLMIIPVCLLFPMVPFILALITSIPAMLLRKIMKNRFFLILLGSIFTISVGYIAYMTALEFVLNMVFLKQSQINFTPEIVASITEFARFLLPQALLSNLLYGQDVLMSILIIMLSSYLMVSLVLVCADKWYYEAFFKQVESANVLKQTKSRLVKGGEFVQLVNREFVNIFRSVNYSFQYLALASCTPVMVYFCSRLTAKIGVGNIGELILPGLVLLVVIMFVALSSSFAASTFTREGNKIYHINVIPSSVKMQVASKLFVYSIVAISSILISNIVLLMAHYLDGLKFFTITITCILAAVGGICNSIKRDIVHPSFKDLGMGEMTETNKNTVVSIAVGILTSLILGAGVIAMCYSDMLNISLWAMIVAGVIFAGLSVLRLFVGLNKAFKNIEP